MAVLNNIRKHGIFLIVIIALALFSFVLADVIRQGGFGIGQSQNAVGSINGKEISNLEFDNHVQALRQNYPEGTPSSIITNQAWETMVRQTLMDEQIEKAKIDVGSQQLSSALGRQFGQNPEFLTNEQFDVNKFKAYIEQLRAISPESYQQWLLTENQVIEQVKGDSYFALLLGGMQVTPAEAKEVYELGNERFDLQYVKIPFSAVPDDQFSVADSEIQNYINTHKEQYTTDGLRDIRYVLFEEKPTQADEDEAKASLSELLDDYTTYNKAAGIEETEKGFKNTTDYDRFLAENSDLSYEDNYSLKGDLPADFAEALFALKEGEIYGPYKDNGYWKYSKLVAEKQMPDSVKLKHILISYEGLPTGQGTERTSAEAKQLADSLVGVLKNAPNKFNGLVTQYSDDTGTKDKEGDLGWFPFPREEKNEFVDFAFSNDPQSVKVITSQYGYHVAFVDDIKNKQRAVKLATLAKEITPSEQTQNNLFNAATEFQVAAQNGDFSEAAQKDGYEVKVVKSLKPMDENITGIGSYRNIVKWAFEANNKPGTITRFDTDRGYVVAQLTAVTTKGLMSTEEASDIIKPLLLNEKKGTYLKDHIQGKELSSIAGEYQAEVKTKNNANFLSADIEGREPKVIARAFSLKEGDVSEPIVGRTGVYVIKMIKRNKAEEISSYDGIISQENQKNMIQASQRLLQALEDKAEITNRLSEFY